MAEQKTLKVTNIATGQVFFKTPDEIKAIKGSKVLKGRFLFEKEADTPPLANKIAPSQPATPAPAAQVADKPADKPADAPKQ